MLNRIGATDKPKVFIASPLFNGPQIEIIQRIEDLISSQGFEYYSARLHSGSAGMTHEQRKDPKAWEPVMESNLRGLDECSMMVAVVEYAFPSTGKHVGTWLCGYSDGIEYEEVFEPQTKVELPDAGTVWEMGYHTAQGKPVVAFHSRKAPGHLNLMLSHSVVGILSGWENLEAFLRPDGSCSCRTSELRTALMANQRLSYTTLRKACPHFDWSQLHRWNSEVE